MICKKCETILSEDAKFCPVCGAAVEAEPQPVAPPEPAPQPEPQPVVQPAPQPAVAPAPAPVQPQKKFSEEDIPSQYQLMGPWAYFWLNILFSVPVVGFVFLIVFSFSKGNLNRRNYARSFWCAWLVVAVITVIFFLIIFVIALISGMSMAEIAGSSAPTMMY